LYSVFFQISFGIGLKVQNCLDNLIRPEFISNSPPTCSDHNSWTVGRMRVYLCFLESSRNSLSLSYFAFFLILHCVESTGFCEIVVCLNQNLSYYFIVVVYLEFWFVVSVRWMKVDSFLPCFDRWTTTPTLPSELTDGSVAMGCTISIFPPCFGTCCTALATRKLPCTVVVRTISLGLGVARSTWTSRLTSLTRPWWLCSPRLEAMISTTL
jgi:hypothetical protein